MKFVNIIYAVCVPLAAAMMAGCHGIFAGVYDEPPAGGDNPVRTVAGQLYIDASDWTQWHYIDIPALADSVAADSLFNTSSLWHTFPIPMEEVPTAESVDGSGIYTYWYDVFGDGISTNEFRSYMPTLPQPEPEKWTIAIHRNNVRTNGCTVAATSFGSFDDIPRDKTFLSALTFEADTWNETDVWCQQDRMLLGFIGNQGIEVNSTLSSWLAIYIPPIPPSFTMNGNVYIVRLPDGSLCALQLADYISPSGTRCCLTVNYRYPI